MLSFIAEFFCAEHSNSNAHYRNDHQQERQKKIGLITSFGILGIRRRDQLCNGLGVSSGFASLTGCDNHSDGSRASLFGSGCSHSDIGDRSGRIGDTCLFQCRSIKARLMSSYLPRDRGIWIRSSSVTDVRLIRVTCFKEIR